MSVALQIRDVPEAVRDALARHAAASGRSSQAYLLEVVTREAHVLENLELFASVGSAEEGTDVVAAIHEARTARDAEITRRLR